MSDKPISIWSVKLNDGDWYLVFATTWKQAIAVVIDTHYDEMSYQEFDHEYSPVVERIPNDREVTISDDQGGQETRTAIAWCEGEGIGPFSSNTYGI